MSDCDCIIGTYEHRETLRMSEYVEILNHLSKVQAHFHEMGIRNHKPLSAVEIADNRRGYVHRFNYCPYCGVKHDWKQLTKALK